MTEAELPGVQVFLVDDHPAVREGLSLLLASKGLVVCGEAGSIAEALALLAGVAPAVVLVDLTLGAENGIELIATLRGRSAKILVYSMHDDGERIAAAFGAGADGYVTKREMASTLLLAIATVLAGERYLSPVAETAQRQAASGAGRLVVERLSERERELFGKMGEGYSTADLAEQFAISASTVETYYGRIREKLNLTGAKELRLAAIRFRQGR